MLAEQTLQHLAERIADDLPDDLAVLTALSTPAPTTDDKPGLIGVVGNIEGLIDGVEREPGQAIPGY